MLKITKKQLKLSPKKLSSLMVASVIFITLVILITVSLFLYKNFYMTITQTEEIIILREKVAIDTVNMEKFDIIMAKLADKTRLKEFKNIINPFR